MTAHSFILDFSIFLFASFFLIKGTHLLTGGLEKMSKSNNAALFALTSFFAAMATSLPELLVSINSAIAGKPNMAVGLVIGSNIADVTIAIGLACLISGSLPVLSDFVTKDVFKAFFMSLLPVFFALDGEISRVDGVQLVFLFILYYVFMFKNKRKYRASVSTKPFEKLGKWVHGVMEKYDKSQVGLILIGVIMLLYSSDMLVESGLALAIDLNLPVIFIGMFFAALGTSLPELVFSIDSIRKQQTSMLFGNLLGSLVANSTLILGITALIKPITFSRRMNSSGIAVLVYIISFLLLWLFIRTKYKLERWEGAILTIIYILFIVSQLFIK